MDWKRRRPRWPYAVALGWLFALTLVAPWAWQRLRGPQAVSPIAPAETPEAAALQAVDPVVVAPQLPPLAVPDLAESLPVEATIAEPAVAADDYVAVNEPLLVEPQLNGPPSAEPRVEPVLPTLADVATIDSQSAESLAPFRLNPTARSVLVDRVAAPAAPRPAIYNVES
jgi:hypothetical protein